MTINKVNSETSLKVISPDKEFLDEIINYLKQGFDCKTTSPKMWSEEKSAFFQYLSVARRS